LKELKLLPISAEGWATGLDLFPVPFQYYEVKTMGKLENVGKMKLSEEDMEKLDRLCFNEAIKALCKQHGRVFEENDDVIKILK